MALTIAVAQPAGHSTIWRPDGTVADRAGVKINEIAATTLT